MILALDIEGTLVKSYDEPVPRPGLRGFLDWAGQAFDRIVIFTALNREAAKHVLQGLVDTGQVPEWILSCDYYRAAPKPGDIDDDEDEIFCKDLLAVHDDLERIFLVDDHRGYVLADQRQCWIEIRRFTGAPDAELARVREELEARLKAGPENRA